MEKRGNREILEIRETRKLAGDTEQATGWTTMTWPRKGSKSPARPAATKKFEQEQTEKTEAEKLCRKCAIARE
jgi:hypothetical protein